VCGWLALVPLLVVVRDEDVRSAFWFGVLFGYAYGWALTWCFADAAARYFRLPLPVAVAGMSLWYLVVCGVPAGFFGAATAFVWRSLTPVLRCLVIPALWTTTELLRGRILEEPWALLGYSQHTQIGLIQVGALTGVYGVSFLLVLGATAITILLESLREPAGRAAALRTASFCAIAVVACWLGGALVARRPLDSSGPRRRVAIVQTDIAPSYHWSRTYTAKQISAHIAASDNILGNEPPDIIVWPENSVPRYLETEPMLAVELARVAKRHRADLLFGGPRYEDGATFNSVRLITAEGRNGGSYDKQRLVLFAEEKPFAASVADAPQGPDEFSVGSGSPVLRGVLPLGVSICHEITYPELIGKSVSDGAGVLVNVANDGWLDGGLGVASGQHWAMAAFRAAETRRYVVRANTTGLSGIVDPYGRVVEVLPAGTAATLQGEVVAQTVLTPYVRFGDAFAGICAIVAALALAARLRALQRRSALTAAAAAA
jgi:apolipoprotein N-acyltransferase